jgi:DNA ligase 1
MIASILNQLRQTTSTNEKIAILEREKSLEFIEFARLVYDKVAYKYYITNSQLNYDTQGCAVMDAFDLRNALIPIFARQKTGNEAIEYVQNLINSMNANSQERLRCILDRDMHAGINIKTIEKVYGKIMREIPYMRCSLADQAKNISYPALLQLKADGTYRTAIVKGGVASFFSRSGEEYEHPLIAEELKYLPDGVYIGEMIVRNDESKASAARYASNGALNSLNPPKDVDFFVWDLLTLNEFDDEQSIRKYKDRFEYLQSITIHFDRVKAIQTTTVQSYDEAREIADRWINAGNEGAVLKDYNMPFENKTSKFQIKLKKEIEIDLECTGFTQGKGKFASTFGAITFKSCDGKLEGQCSGISDAERSEIAKNKDSYIGKILTIKCNDITKAKNSEIYGVMHPQFKGFRNDKSIADSIERILEMGKF